MTLPPQMESETCEFKKSLSELKEGVISISAMLNKHGYGELWIGLAPDGSAKGLTVTEKSLRDVSQSIANHIEPRIYPHVTKERVNGKSCIYVNFDGQEKPYYGYGRVYMRVADEDRQMSAKEIENLIVCKNQERLRWDNEASKLAIKDLDKKRLKRFVERAKLPWDRAGNALDKLGLLREGKLLNPARLFFTAEPMELRCAVFGTTSSSMIIDRHDFRGDILELIEEAQKYILKNIRIGMKLNGLYREDVPEISMEALREAIINAFCHRDYRDPDFIQVAIFKNRVEIRNPGTLFGGLKLEDLKKGHLSKRRNPTLAELFRRIEMVEAWGRGLPLIMENAPNVEFKETAGIFIAEFTRPSYLKDDENPKTSVKTPKTSVKTPKTSVKTPKASVKTLKASVKTPKTSVKIIQVMTEKNKITIPELAEITGISIRSVERNIQKLQEEGKLKRVGPDKGGHWVVLT